MQYLCKWMFYNGKAVKTADAKDAVFFSDSLILEENLTLINGLCSLYLNTVSGIFFVFSQVFA